MDPRPPLRAFCGSGWQIEENAIAFSPPWLEYRTGNRTHLCNLKPTAAAWDGIGEIYRRFEPGGLQIVAAKLLHLGRRRAGDFYAVHGERPFFPDLVACMTAGPIMVQVLEGENAIARNRELMGATDPQQAVLGAMRADLALGLTENSVHGSDCPARAQPEIAVFFAPEEICERIR